MTEAKSHFTNLAVVCNTTRCGGVYRVASTLCNTWSRQGRKVSLIALYDYESFFHLEPSVQRVDALTSQETNGVARVRRKGEKLLARVLTGLKHFCPARSSDSLLLNAGSLWLSHRVGPLRAALQQTDASVVIAFGWQANILTILACRTLGRKIVISERNDVACRRLEYPWEELRSGLYNRADIVTANTVGALKTMQAYVDDHKLVFVPNPMVRHESGANTPRPSAFDAPFVLIVGNLDRLKAHDILLGAFARLSPDLSNWRLAIVGGGDEEKTLREQVRTLGIAERVDWHGRVADPFVFYRAASIFVLPSRSEGMPNALMEAMSCGLPVIVSNASPGPLALVKDGETGLVVPVGDPVALANAIELLATDAALRNRLGDAARKHVSEYELSNVMPIWEQITATDPAANRQGVASSGAPHLFPIS
jgi:glycosyltransferase involved in cell wall biosynthesis